MADIAALNLQVNSTSLEQANVSLREMPKAATAAERAAQRWGMTTKDAARSADDFSKRVQGTIKSLQFETEQLKRSSAEQAKYAALRRAGVSAMSAEGQAIARSVAALQAQRAAANASAEATRKGGAAFSALAGFMGPAVIAYLAIGKAQEIWSRGMKAADLGEQAEQLGINTDQLQAYRYAAAQAGIESGQMDVALTKLAKTMGAAADGGKEQIELFTKLGVKLLDARGELRPVADVLPEVAKGVLGIGSSSQRTATLMELFGKSGSKMATVLEEIAKGNDRVVDTAKAAGAVASPEIIKAWEDYADALKRAELQADVTYAKLGAPIATAGLEAVANALRGINGLMDQINSKEGFWESVLSESRSKGRIGSGPNALRLETPQEATTRRREELEGKLKSDTNTGRREYYQQELNKLAGQDIASSKYYGEDMAGAASRGTRATPIIRSGGVSNPTPKATGGGSDPYKSAIESAREYVLAKNAETAAVGLSVMAAARMTHEQGLLNKAQTEGKTVSAAQKVEIANLAQQMAEADAKLAGAKFMDEAVTKSQEFIASQEIEQAALFMSAEAADAYRISQGYLNDAKAKGIELSDVEKQKLIELAAAQAAAAQKTNEMKDAIAFAKDVTKGFFTDIRQGVEEGKSALEIFGNAFINILEKIASKLMDLAIDDLFTGGNSTGGFFNAIGGILGNILGGGGVAGSGTLFANGGAFNRGNVIPFASGGIVDRPTVFPFARGVGLMGEAGPEAIMPLRRGRGGRLGVETGGSGGGQPVVVYVTGDTDLVRVTSNQEAVKVVTAAAPKIEGSAVNKSTKAVPSAVAVDHAERGGDHRL